MARRQSIARNGLIIVILLLAVELGFVAVIASTISRARTELLAEQHSLAVLEVSSRIAGNLQTISTLLTMNASGLMSDIQLLTDVEKIQTKLNRDFSILKEFSVEDRDARTLLFEQKRFMEEAQRLFHEDQVEEMHKKHLPNIAFKAERKELQRDLLGNYNSVLEKYRKDRENEDFDSLAALTQLQNVVLIGAVLNILGGMALAYLFTRSVVTRIERLSAAIAELDDHDFYDQKPVLLRVSKKGEEDELSEIERSFKHMVDDLNQAAGSERMLIEGAYDVICTFDYAGRIATVNQACQRQWGRSVEEIIGTHYNDLIAREDLPRFTTFLESLRESKNGSGEIAVKTIVQSKGETVKIDTRWSCFWSEAELSVFCFVHDTSEQTHREEVLRQAEEQVGSLIKNLPVGILVVDPKGQVKAANRKMEELLGSAAVRVGEVITVDEISAVPSVEITSKALDESGDLLFVANDVRERVRLENIKRDFVSLLQESLHQPLMQVRTEVASVSSVGDENKIQRIVRNSDRLLHLIDELIKVETLRPGKIIEALRPVDLFEILSEAVNALAGYAATQGVQVDFRCPSIIIMADAERLVQVVINLLSNAIKFSPSGSEVLLYSATEDDIVEISIVDSGKGIPADVQDTIFAPYIQASKEDSKKGTGLGLAICKNIIEAHGGTIGVDCSEKGSRFWFHLPLTSSTGAGL